MCSAALPTHALPPDEVRRSREDRGNEETSCEHRSGDGGRVVCAEVTRRGPDQPRVEQGTPAGLAVQEGADRRGRPFDERDGGARIMKMAASRSSSS